MLINIWKLTTQVIVLSILLIIISAGTYFVVDSMMDKYFAVKYPVPIYVDDQVDFRSRIKSLAQGYESIGISVARYLIAQYVINKEEYKYSGLNQDMTPRKIQIVLLKYKLQIERAISIESVKFPGGVNKPNIAHVLFKAVEKNSTKESASYWLAEINFSLNSITNVLDYESNLNFIVIAYEIMKKTDYKG
ncbi:MAG: hypothetical protein MTP17_03980 [Candidatus Midichloria sp.]|nr:MAG: hypothetical protein MTP17_03980 [Candidatus Midichloria sp.]